MMSEGKAIAELGWNWDNSYARLPGSFFTPIKPSPVRSPQLVILNETLATDLGLNIQEQPSENLAAIFSGNQIPEGSLPLAQAYAGHQFGHLALLGDGRALLLGEQITPQGKRLDIQLKGSGKTPYSRRGDGRAALGPMLREYLISEAMHALGIPTTRSLAVVTTGETVSRETVQDGAILTRVASSHLRVGTFQYAAWQGELEELQALADYTLQRHFPGFGEAENPYLYLLQEVSRRQAALIAKWQQVGFIHGVMNTDNMALSGETIDYGPCAFMDIYDPATVFSSIDQQGRYAYGNQPQIALWNLARFAETLLPLLNQDQDTAVATAEKVLKEFEELYRNHWLAGMRAKIGLFNNESEDASLIDDLLSLMLKYRADYTNTFLALTFGKHENMPFYGTSEFSQWQEQWLARLQRQPDSQERTLRLMRASNPALIPRNHRVEAALEAAVKQGDYSVLQSLLKALSNPYAHTPDQVEYSVLPEQSCSYKTFCGT